VQTLADGNRIVHKTNGLVARDGEGRTRREQTLGSLGPFGPSAPPRTFFIHDTVTGVSYALFPDEKVARKMGHVPFFTTMVAPPEGAPPHDIRFRRSIVLKDKPADKPGDEGQGPERKHLPKPETVSLGTKTIEGVSAVGTRTTVTIPAGDIGNERPIEIVNERWESPELKVVILSRSSDPRFGETTYRLTGLTRGEPDRSLFEVPSDYTVKDEGPGNVEVRKIIRDKKD